jgi:hypothetical protein
MAKYSLSDFFSEQHGCSRKDLNKAVIAAVTGRDAKAVLAMFRMWHASTNFSYVAFKRLALSKPEPLTRGRINSNVTEKRKEIESLAYGEWKPRAHGEWKPKPKLAPQDGLVIPPIPPTPQQEIPSSQFYPRPKPYVPRKPKPEVQVQSEEEEEWFEIEV